ncbi:MAG: DUF4293 domain-containing protein [Bacteroidetes bacterium]|nr:DUF4293 domain-containing protein [Bacteroidota bacterium]
MIQRIQSLYLLLIFLICNLMFFGNPTYARFENSQLLVKLGAVKTTTSTKAGGAQPISTLEPLNVVLVIAVGLGALVTVFLFRNTVRQRKICIYLTLAAAALLVLMVLRLFEVSGQSSGYPGLHLIWPIACVVLGWMAWWGIRSDEKLLEGMDRIR